MKNQITILFRKEMKRYFFVLVGPIYRFVHRLESVFDRPIDRYIFGFVLKLHTHHHHSPFTFRKRFFNDKFNNRDICICLSVLEDVLAALMLMMMMPI